MGANILCTTCICTVPSMMRKCLPLKLTFPPQLLICQNISRLLFLCFHSSARWRAYTVQYLSCRLFRITKCILRLFFDTRQPPKEANQKLNQWRKLSLSSSFSIGSLVRCPHVNVFLVFYASDSFSCLWINLNEKYRYGDVEDLHELNLVRRVGCREEMKDNIRRLGLWVHVGDRVEWMWTVSFLYSMFVAFFVMYFPATHRFSCTRCASLDEEATYFTILVLSRSCLDPHCKILNCMTVNVEISWNVVTV